MLKLINTAELQHLQCQQDCIMLVVVSSKVQLPKQQEESVKIAKYGAMLRYNARCVTVPGILFKS